MPYSRFRQSPEYIGALLAFAFTVLFGVLIMCWPAGDGPNVFPVRAGCLLAMFVVFAWVLLRCLQSWRHRPKASGHPRPPDDSGPDILSVRRRGE